MSETTIKKGGFHYAFVIFVGGCCLSMGGMALTLSILGVYLGPKATELGSTPGDFALWAAVATITSAIVMSFWGRFLQTKNINVCITIAALILITGTLAMGFTTAVWQTYIIGFWMGLGWAPIVTLGMPLLVGNWFAPSVRGRFLGIASAFTGVGTFIWAPSFTLIMQNFGIQTTYIANAILMAVLILPFSIFLFKFKPEDMGLKPYGHIEEDSATTAAQSAADKAGISVSKAFKTPTFWLFMFAMLFMGIGMGFNSNQPKMAAEFLEGLMQPEAIALLGASMISVAAVGNILSKIAFGWVVDKLGIRPAFIVFIVLYFLAFATWLLFPSMQIMLIVGAFLLGTHNSLMSVGIPLAVRTFYGNRDFSKIYARIGVVAAVISGLGTSVVAYIVQFVGSYTASNYVGIVFVIIMGTLLILALNLGKKYIPEAKLIPEDA